jgi:hypothetical protein
MDAHPVAYWLTFSAYLALDVLLVGAGGRIGYELLRGTV